MTYHVAVTVHAEPGDLLTGKKGRRRVLVQQRDGAHRTGGDAERRPESPEGQLALHTFIAPDNVMMGSLVADQLMKAIGGKGNVVMTQGALGHTGAQGRAKGFAQVVANYPDVKVVDEQPADWDVTKVARIWEEDLGDARETADAWRRVLRMKAADPEATQGLERAKTGKLKRATPAPAGAEPAKIVSTPAAAPSSRPPSAPRWSRSTTS